MSVSNSMEVRIPVPPKRKSLNLFVAAIAVAATAGNVMLFKYPDVISMVSEGGHLNAASQPYFLETPQVLINFNDEENIKLLRFSAQLEVTKNNHVAVNDMMPRIVDVINTYLRGLSAETIRDPGTLFQIRSDLLIRAQVVTGEELIKKFLIKEFIIQ